MRIIPKNTRAELRIQLDEYRETDLINMRIFYASPDGEMRPSRKGLAMRVGQLPLIVATLVAEEQEAIRRGLLPDPDVPTQEDAA